MLTFSKSKYQDKKMRKLLTVFSLLLFMLTASSMLIAQQKDAEDFERQQIAVIPNTSYPQLTGILNSALGSDKRFQLIDQTAIPEILGEWERRQTGITENDDTENMKLKNIYFFVQITDVYLNTEKVEITYEVDKTDRNGNPIKDKYGNTLKETKTKIEYKTTINSNLKVTKVKEGGAIEIKSVNTSASTSDRNSSYESALSSYAGSLKVQLKILFPIQAKIFKVTGSRVVISRGSTSGVSKGQKYIIFESTPMQFGEKTVNKKDEAAFIQIDDLQDQYSEGYIILGSNSFNLGSSIAEEKYFTGTSIEFLYSINQYTKMDQYIIKNGLPTADKMGHDFGKYDGSYALNILFGTSWMFGVSGNLNYTAGFLTPGVSLLFKYDLHVYRRLYFVPTVEAGLIVAMTSASLRVGDSTFGGIQDSYGNYKLNEKNVSLANFGWMIKAGGGFKFMLTKNLYLLVNGGYTLSSTMSSWKYSPAEDEKDEKLLKSIKDYSNYINDYSMTGPYASLGIGASF